MYEISRLIKEVLSNSKERKRQVVRNLGYKNLNKGYRRLYDLLEEGICPDSSREKLPKALNIEKELIDQAFLLTAQEKAREAELARQRREEYDRKCFVPHIWMENEDERPTGAKFWFIVFVGIDKFKVLTLPEYINKLSWTRQQTLVKERILQHQKESKGEYVIFGKVAGYIYKQTYDDSFVFSVDGNFLGKNTPKPHKPELYIEVGNKKIKDGVLYNS